MTYTMVMISVNIHEAKANLSHYLTLAEQGEKVVFCKRNIPIVELHPLKQQKRALGLAKGTVWLAPDFDTLPDDVIKSFE